MKFEPIKKVYDMQQTKALHLAVESAKFFIRVHYPGIERIPEMRFKYVDAHLCYLTNTWT
jgi:hypothetical protein